MCNSRLSTAFCYTFFIKQNKVTTKKRLFPSITVFVCIFLLIIAYILVELSGLMKINYEANVSDALIAIVEEIKPKPRPVLDKKLYEEKMKALANNPITGTSSTSTVVHLWPPKAAEPLGDALLPFNRIVAYYGNFYSTRMGALGEYEPSDMLQRLQAEAEKWRKADPTTPVIPAIHYIVTTAQGSPGFDGMYRLRMPSSQVDKALDLANQINGIVFLDIQVGLSNLQAELPAIEKYLKLPNVHLGIDPEFSMKNGNKPGTVIGTMDAADINYATDYLSKLVIRHNIPPKILVIHRFTQNMVTNYKNIKTIPEVQIVMDMDGWGSPSNKINTYKSFIYPEPVQFTGFKLFYKNDLRPVGSRLLTPEELLKLRPKPIYIQYQ